ncbi:hypothetical protein [Streptomyces olivaceoviridis]|uniref:hypothetical protein n=1 Tax=Streptomyces olivaceoviridis TaxID=1921 RepID=UPI0037BBC738
MTKTFAMSQDFAAITSATMAALLILVVTELQATANQMHEVRTKLLTEHGTAIQASFDAFYSGTPLSPQQLKHVEREIHRFRSRSYSSAFDLFYRVHYSLAAFASLAGLAGVLRWSALAHPSKGYLTASGALAAIAYSALALFVGYCIRQSVRNKMRRQEWLLGLCELLGVPDARDVRFMWSQWLAAEHGGGFLRPDYSLMLKPWKMFWFLKRHVWDDLR